MHCWFTEIMTNKLVIYAETEHILSEDNLVATMLKVFFKDGYSSLLFG